MKRITRKRQGLAAFRQPPVRGDSYFVIGTTLFHLSVDWRAACTRIIRMLSLASKNRHRLPCLLAGLLLWDAAGADIIANIQPLHSIQAAAEKFVREQMPADAKGIIVTATDLDSRLRLVQCAEPLRAAQVSGARLQARTSIGVSCRRGAEWTIYVPVDVESEIPVLVLRVPAARGARIAATDVATETRRVSGLAVGYVTETKALERHTVARPLPAGSMLTTDMLIPDFIVRSGEQVTLMAAAGGIEVRATGRALADGRDGTRIRVQNLNSLKIVEGTVDSDRVIHVTP